MKHSSFLPLFAGLACICLILDSRSAAQYASEALAQCLNVVIPSLFPMFVLSGLLVPCLQNARRGLGFLERLLGLPQGSGSIFLLGIVGGFPVGAQCVVQGLEQGTLSKEEGESILGLCNNCSPAFLFGITPVLFQDALAPLWLFLIQLETAALAARLFCASSATGREPAAPSRSAPSLPQAVQRAIRSMVVVCAWVVLAGVVTGFLRRWLFPLLPGPMPQLFTGLLELTGGVLSLAECPGEDLRFCLCALFVCFGGISVLLQIQSIAQGGQLSMGPCIRQKLFQAAAGAIFALLCVRLGPAILGIAPVILLFSKKRVEIPGKVSYNTPQKGGC